IIDAIQSVRQAIRYAPDEQNYWGYLIHLYNMLPDIELDDEMKGDVASIITSHDLSLAPITALACKFILNDPEVRKLIAKATASIDTFAIEEWLSDETLNALSQPIIQSYVARARLIEVGFERVLTNVRRAILLSSNGPPINIDLLSAIADQCFYNEYVFLISDEEANALIRLEQHMTSTLADGDKLQPEEIAIYASYKALFKLPGFSKNVAKDHALLHPDVSGLIQHQILEPLSEREIIIEIPSISEISDQVSQKVRAQYEENPFPRWRNFEKSVVVSLKHYLKNMFNVGEEGDEFPSSPRILVAGCGTGRHPIAVAQTIEKCHVLAVDLSQASIAYGWRKAREYEVKNIEFKHGDILSLGELQTEFDMIECSGVLHHMENPEAGWKVLTGLLSPSGYMKVGLYSELARQNVVVAARSFIAERGIPSTIEGIREFRKLVFEMPDDHPVKSVVSYLDFFTASDCRDLLFHVQEHRFTISRIRTALANLNLEFCGFHFAGQNTEIAAYKEAYPDDPSCLSLDNWEAFEDKNPNTFAAMYNFFVRKAPAN
ncbi:MAG: class I SAM-dependent methyltransferase, partial [Rhodospirillales bacterium]|nr:class I SAM-dependent methyltransferase [Rhodospirillales bacterium]